MPRRQPLVAFPRSVPVVEPVVVDVDVETNPDGTLSVRWAVEGAATPVDVAVGPTPELVDHVHHVTVPAGRTETTVAPPATARTFVSVAPAGGGPATVAADRRVPFEGISNFRDLGGYRTSEGGRVRWGRVYRADALHDLTDGDLALYETLGMHAVYDLRSEVERRERPNPVDSTWIALIGRPRDGRRDLADEWREAVDGEQVLRGLYRDLLDNAAPTIGTILTEIAGGSVPAVFHCHAGKDRTGVVAAVLLLALGVDRERVLDDYELTARYRLRVQQESTYRRLLDAGLPPEAAAGVLTTPRWAMADAIDHVIAGPGIERWLVDAAGMSPDSFAALRRLLVEI